MLLGVGYGACMGLFGALRGGADGWLQLFATMVKVPVLFLVTLVVTFPSLYVSSALAESRLEALATMRLLLAAIAVDLALLASLGPVIAFFTVSTTSYPFMVLLNVLVFALAGGAGVAVLRKALSAVFPPPGEMEALSLARGNVATRNEAAVTFEGDATSGDDATPGVSAAERASLLESGEQSVEERSHRRRARPISASTPRAIFKIWIVILAVVGAQLGWVLRPFIGSPGMPFTWLRPRQSNFFAACVEALGQLLQ